MSPEMLVGLLWKSLLQTLHMVAVSGLLGSLIGLPIGVFLATSGKGELFPAPKLNYVIGLIVNAARSTPFIILVVAIIPFTRLLAGTSIGTTAAIVPLTIATIPFFARLVEAAIREIDKGLIEAARAMGATPLQIVFKVLLAEADDLVGNADGPSLVQAGAEVGVGAAVGADGADHGRGVGHQGQPVDAPVPVAVGGKRRAAGHRGGGQECANQHSTAGRRAPRSRPGPRRSRRPRPDRRRR